MGKYDPVSNQWTYVGEMNIARSAHAACVLHDQIYVVGGITCDGQVVKEIDCYDPSNNNWNIVRKVTDDFLYHTVAAV